MATLPLGKARRATRTVSSGMDPIGAGLSDIPQYAFTESGLRRQYQTYLKVKGKWCYLYRAIDREGNLVDSMLSATRDMVAAQQFFRKTLSVAEEAPQQVSTDGHDSYPRAIREVLGTHVDHRDNAYLN